MTAKTKRKATRYCQTHGMKLPCMALTTCTETVPAPRPLPKLDWERIDKKVELLMSSGSYSCHDAYIHAVERELRRAGKGEKG